MGGRPSSFCSWRRDDFTGCACLHDVFLPAQSSRSFIPAILQNAKVTEIQQQRFKAPHCTGIRVKWKKIRIAHYSTMHLSKITSMRILRPKHNGRMEFKQNEPSPNLFMLLLHFCVQSSRKTCRLLRQLPPQFVAIRRDFLCVSVLDALCFSDVPCIIPCLLDTDHISSFATI